MSGDRETSSRSLASTTQHHTLHSESVPANTVPTPKDKRRKRSSTTSNDTATDTKPLPSRRRSGISKTLTAGTDADPTRAARRSTTSPSNMSTVNYTKTGRVSKAKKGLKVHDCECGRSYTRAEHLRRHQRNHAEEGGLVCKFPGCGKTFFRSDLLQRHEERHNEHGGDSSRQPSVDSSEHSVHPSPMTAPASLSMAPAQALPTESYPQQSVMSSQPDPSTLSRYNPAHFRTPQHPRTPRAAPARSSNHFLQSHSIFKTPPTGGKITQNMAYLRHSISGPVPVDSMTGNGAWVPETFAPSPYSCSSGYASPALCPEYGHMYATPPYGTGIVRTRTSSNASFVEQNWTHASQSPTLSISLPYSWATDEKSLLASTFPYTPVSYATTNMPLHASIGTIPHYVQYDPQNIIQMEHEESVHLFPQEHYGMSQIARPSSFEQWLNSYWRLFHPTFPIIHRFTFASLETSPMLCAAMAAIGAHHTNDSYHAQDLHDRCVKLLTKRQELNVVGCDRLCDMQATFLVEVFALNFARRCGKSFSARFVTMYDRLAGVRSADPSVATNSLLQDSTDDACVQSRWLQWVTLSAKHRLLVSCYLLEARHHPILTEAPSSRVHVDSLHFPSHETLWEAQNPREWWIHAQEYSMMPGYIAEAIAYRIVGSYDAFQSSVLIAALYPPSSYATPQLQPAVEHLLHDDATTQQRLSIAKLVQLVPVRSLLAVSGESWLLGTKVTSQNEFAAYKTELQLWVAHLWSNVAGGSSESSMEALRLSVEILTHSLKSQEASILGFNDLGLFFAALVLWAATAAASSKLHTSSFFPQQTQSLVPPVAIAAPGMSLGHPKHTAAASTSNAAYSNPTARSISDRRSSIPYAEIAANTSHFLLTAVDDVASLNVSACQVGCKFALLWVKMQLRSGHSNGQDIISSDDYVSDHTPGELISEIIGQIERILRHKWANWGI